MIQHSRDIEETVVLNVARSMCAAARTAPKTRGEDHIETCIVSGGEKENLAREMERLGGQFGYDFFLRDAQNVRESFAVVLIGVRLGVHKLNDGCGYCNFKNCGECIKSGGLCAYDPIDLGIAVGSAVSIASDARVDNRVMFSVGRAAISLAMLGEDVKNVLGIPLSASGKSPFFDRKFKR